MASIQTRNSVLAIKKETTEGVPVPPAASADYVALQDDFSMEPGTETLANAELKASIGQAKPILGAENPTASFSHYFRASGVEGLAPNYGELLEASLGAVVVASTEYNTIAGSTTTAVKVDTGEGAFFQRGQSLLLKDATNGYRLRFVDSVSGDDLSLSFATLSATSTGTNLGKSVLYKPANTDHPSLTIWHYLGNGGAVQMMAGARVVSADFNISAGQLINAAYSLEGIGFYFDPIRVIAGSNEIAFDIGGGPLVATIAADFYKTPIELADAIATAMTAAAGVAITCTYSSTTGKFTVTKASGTLNIDWLTGANSIGATIGFTADDTGALTYVGDAAISFASPQTPTFDSSDPLAAKDNEVMLGLQSEYECFNASSVTLSIGTPKANILSVCSESGISGSVINSREVTVNVSALLPKYEARLHERYRVNTAIRFQYSAGVKAGGNWVAGKVAGLYIPTATISSASIVDADGLAQIDLTLTAFVNDSGEGEVYLAFN